MHDLFPRSPSPTSQYQPFCVRPLGRVQAILSMLEFRFLPVKQQLMESPSSDYRLSVLYVISRYLYSIPQLWHAVANITPRNAPLTTPTLVTPSSLRGPMFQHHPGLSTDDGRSARKNRGTSPHHRPCDGPDPLPPSLRLLASATRTSRDSARQHQGYQTSTCGGEHGPVSAERWIDKLEEATTCGCFDVCGLVQHSKVGIDSGRGNLGSERDNVEGSFLPRIPTLADKRSQGFDDLGPVEDLEIRPSGIVLADILEPGKCDREDLILLVEGLQI